MIDSYRLRSLWDMYELDASAFHEATMVIRQAISMVDGRKMPEPHAIMPDDMRTPVKENLRNFAKGLASLHVPVTRLAVVDLIKDIDRLPSLSYFDCGSLMLQVQLTLRRELTTTKVYSLDAQRAHFYASQEPLFGSDVASKFSSIAYEIDQAGKCYACDLTTASAFHSIRCLEAAITALSRCLGIPDPTKGADRTWGKVLGAIKAEMEVKWPSKNGRMAGDAQLFDEIYGSLAAMQNPYRNATMHLDAKYTAPEAIYIFEVVKGLIQRIASRMDQDGVPMA